MFTFTIICLLLLAIGHYGSKFAKKMADTINEEKQNEQDYKDRTLRALERMADAVSQDEEVEEEPSVLDRFLAGNEKILEKQKVKQAMKDELGIN